MPVQKPDYPTSDIDNLLIHDSTGKKILINKLFPQGERNQKRFAGKYDQALSIIEATPKVNKTIILMLGVREVRYGISYENLSNVVRAARSKYPKAKILLVSVPPSTEYGLRDNITKLNNAMRNLSANCQHVLYCDIFSWLDNMNGEGMSGSHVRDRFLGKVAVSIKVSLGYKRPPYGQSPQRPSRKHNISDDTPMHEVSVTNEQTNHQGILNTVAPQCIQTIPTMINSYVEPTMSPRPQIHSNPNGPPVYVSYQPTNPQMIYHRPPSSNQYDMRPEVDWSSLAHAYHGSYV